MRVVRILLVVLLLFSGLFFGVLIRSRLWGKHFATVKPGASRSVVLSNAGAPSRLMECARMPEIPDGCKSVLVYAGPFSSVMPEFWLIALDRNDRVLKVVHTTRAD